MDKDRAPKCEVIKDLLPLYFDDACSPASRELVEAHLQNCEKCQKCYSALKDRSVENAIAKEAGGVLERHAKKERNAAFKAGLIIAALLLLPIIITFIVTLAYGNSFGTFAVLVAAMLLLAALTVVPLLSKKNKLLRALLLGIAALLLIFFFVDRASGGGNFMLWSVPTIFGLSIPLFPIILRSVSLPPSLADKKGLLTMCWDTVWLFLTIIVVNLHYNTMETLQEACAAAALMCAFTWLGFFIIRYMPANRWIKASLITILSTFCMVFANDLWEYIVNGRFEVTFLNADFASLSSAAVSNADLYALSLIIGAAAAAVFMAIGIVHGKYKKKILFKDN